MASEWRERQKKELRQLLYETAVRLFERDGYEKTTIQQITEHVQVAKGTFYNYFPTKEHVVAQWYNNITFASLEAARKRHSTSVEEAVCSLFEDMARRGTDSPELLIGKSRHSSHEALVAAEQVQDNEVDAYLCELCAAGKAQGELDEELDEEFFVGVLGAVLTGSSRAWVAAQPRFDFPAVIRQRIHFVFRAAKPARR